jgi:hypothetical protein
VAIVKPNRRKRDPPGGRVAEHRAPLAGRAVAAVGLRCAGGRSWRGGIWQAVAREEEAFIMGRVSLIETGFRSGRPRASPSQAGRNVISGSTRARGAAIGLRHTGYTPAAMQL